MIPLTSFSRRHRSQSFHNFQMPRFCLCLALSSLTSPNHLLRYPHPKQIPTVAMHTHNATVPPFDLSPMVPHVAGIAAHIGTKIISFQSTQPHHRDIVVQTMPPQHITIRIGPIHMPGLGVHDLMRQRNDASEHKNKNKIRTQNTEHRTQDT
jgi:hypothetical protein